MKKPEKKKHEEPEPAGAELYGPPKPENWSESAAGGKGKRSAGKRKIPLPVLLAVPAVLLGAALTGVFLKVGAGPPPSAEGAVEPSPEESFPEESSPEESSPEEPSPEEPSLEEADAETADSAAEPSAQAPEAGAQSGAMTVAEVLEYFSALSPQTLGLTGDSMEDYEYYPSQQVVPVDGILCTEVDVYSRSGSAGANGIEGRYLLSRASPVRLFRVDSGSNVVTELFLDQTPAG